MDMTPVKSSNITSIGVLDNDLLVKFKTGTIYRYFGAAMHYDRIIAMSNSGGSVGSYIAANIKKANVPYTKLVEK